MALLVPEDRRCKAQGLKMEAIQEITGLSKAGWKVDSVGRSDNPCREWGLMVSRVFFCSCATFEPQAGPLLGSGCSKGIERVDDVCKELLYHQPSFASARKR